MSDIDLQPSEEWINQVRKVTISIVLVIPTFFCIALILSNERGSSGLIVPVLSFVITVLCAYLGGNSACNYIRNNWTATIKTNGSLQLNWANRPTIHDVKLKIGTSGKFYVFSGEKLKISKKMFPDLERIIHEKFREY